MADQEETTTIKKCRWRWLPRWAHQRIHFRGLVKGAPKHIKRSVYRYVVPNCEITEADLEWAKAKAIELGLVDGDSSSDDPST